MKPAIVVLACVLLAACVTPEQRAAEDAARAERAEAIIRVCEQSGYPRGTQANIDCAFSIANQMYDGSGIAPGAAAYGAYTRGWAAGDRARSGIPEPPERLIISPY